MTTAFSTRLREETLTAHSRAETETFITELMSGKLSTEAYTALLEQYAYFYPALETVGRNFADDPLVAPFLDSRLERTEAIAADLKTLTGSEQPIAEPTAATRQIVGRLEDGISPERYVAHHYLRYLGDLSGGLAIAKLVKRHYGIPAEALNMYTFNEIEKPKVFKDQYRAALDSTPFTADQADALIDEASVVYELNRQMFAQLGQQFLPQPVTA